MISLPRFVGKNVRQHRGDDTVFAAEVRAIVRYPYTAANEDELTLAEGDIITVLDQNIVDAGWWRGELKGHVGVFPDNFVELLPAEEVS